ncbi:prolyl oligopeptidase family serine peptidase [Mangrovicoccus sp. HB182678]|uniref:Prolyl oligopeptidase family serine peptidase n=2 Tax=Mangrovicoccus algicola TaxID=2771008 RepID=A0A8J7CJJ6_9RHOB|nr:prolyl oligopeptidase family serine peptidase [Mangrovicoccus algicola]
MEGEWPDRQVLRVARPELHALAVTAPRGRVLILAGGGYARLMYDKEGMEVARWLARAGLEPHLLLHRLPGQPDGAGGTWPADVALQDGLAALAHLDALEPLPLFILGLSSGGHLAGVLACHAPQAAGALIGYAPLNANHRDHKFPPGKPDYPPAEKQDFYDAWPVGLAAHPHGVPRVPLFLAYALGDRSVPVQHLTRLLETAAAEGLDADAHVFGRAPHGFALRDRSGSHADWPQLALAWMDRRLACG